MRPERPVIAITMGDPAGIGAEIAVKALGEPGLYDTCRPFVVGDLRVVEDALRFTGLELDTNPIAGPDSGRYTPGTVDVMDLGNISLDDFQYGKVSPKAGKAAVEYIVKAVELAMGGSADAIVTGPIHKEAINQAGFHYSGHTELLAELTKAKDYAMMLADGDFRVIHVTTHVSLRQACELIRKDRVYRVIRLAAEAVRLLGVDSPRIAVAGLNPHAGEGGLFGDEEVKEITPAVDQARSEGITVEGPIPPDTVFAKMLGGQYDIVVAMYHDQGHIPIKTLGFKLDARTGKWFAMSGVNITVGLPIIRTSVDHGVAFGKAGKGTANPGSMVEAIRLAAIMAGGRASVTCQS